MEQSTCIPFSAVIDPSGTRLSSMLREVWRRRRLLYVFAWRDAKVRYKQTLLGAAWAVLQPLLTMVVFTVVFGRLARVPSNGVPYPVFVLSGLLPWQFFAHALVRSSRSLVDERYMLTHVYVPRLVLPASAIVSGLLDLAVAFIALLGIMLWYGISPTWSALAVFPFLLLAAATAFGVGLFLSTLNVRFRDVGHTIPFFTQLWFFLTPIAYPSNLVPERWQLLYSLNPMNAIVQGFRQALIGSGATPATLIPGMVVTTFLLAAGVLSFQRMDAVYGDIV